MTTHTSIILVLLATALSGRAQMNIGSNTSPNADAMLEISGSSKGLLLPRVALSGTSSSLPLSAHVAGMSVYNTATAGTGSTAVMPGYYYNTGTAWVRLATSAGSGSAWQAGGNFNGSVNAIGTNDNYDLPLATNNTERMRITNTGNVGIGTSSPVARLDVAAATTTVNTVINATGNINDYLQFNVQNTSTGANAQSGYSSTADNGTATTGFAWMGINNSNFNYPTAYNIGGANDVSFLGSGQDMYLANANNTKSIIFSTGKSTAPYFTERMRITNSGYIGVGTSTPAYPLDVQNNLSSTLSGYGYLNSSGVSGYIVGSSGTTNFSARFSGRIICPEFNAQSDIRIKNVKGASNSASDLETLNRITVTDYEMKDTIQWGHKKIKKVIAQQVEGVYPQAVSRSVGFIPDIYQTGVIMKRGEELVVMFKRSLNISNQARKIRIIIPSGNVDAEIVSVPDDKTLILKGACTGIVTGDQVFVYGEEVNDFRVVDYEALGMLNVSATQELSKQLDALKQENEALKSRLDQLAKDTHALKEDNAARIERLEAALKSVLPAVIAKTE